MAQIGWKSQRINEFYLERWNREELEKSNYCLMILAQSMNKDQRIKDKRVKQMCKKLKLSLESKNLLLLSEIMNCETNFPVKNEINNLLYHIRNIKKGKKYSLIKAKQRAESAPKVEYLLKWKGFSEYVGAV